MTRIYKTAKGKVVDMDKIKLANETTTAVGNMRINARGDLLGSGAQVAVGRNQLMDQVYAVASAESTGYSPNDPKIFAEKSAAATKSKELHDLANGLITTTTEEPVAQDVDLEKTVKAPMARGTLASSVAETAVVTQTLTPDPRKPKGPSRI